jgi:hypothetical protein
MSTSDWITVWGIAAGLFLTSIGSVLVLAFKIGGVNEKMASMAKILEDVPRIKIEIAEMQVKLDVLWRFHLSESKSPLALNDDGIRALETSKIGDFAYRHYPEIFSKIVALKPDNAYQAQELLISIMNRYKKDDEYRPALQDAAFSTGYDVDSLLVVAALSIRDKVIADLAF